MPGVGERRPRGLPAGPRAPDWACPWCCGEGRPGRLLPTYVLALGPRTYHPAEQLHGPCYLLICDASRNCVWALRAPAGRSRDPWSEILLLEDVGRLRQQGLV